MQKKYQSPEGTWALVTGASSGIGEAFCKHLAKEGYNLILVARTESKLQRLSHSLKHNCAIQTRIILADLSNTSDLKKLKIELASTDIKLLINNAGWGQPGVFSKHPLEACIKETQLNINTPLTLTKWFLDYSTKPNRAVIFISSIAGYMGSPYLANYSACKAWSLSFGVALHHELKEQGIDTLVVAPGPTKTGMFGIDSVDFNKLPMHWMKPEDVAKTALNNIGKRSVVVPGSLNKTMSFMMGKVFPRSFAQKIFGSMMKPAMPKHIL